MLKDLCGICHNVYIHRELWHLPLPGMLKMCLYPKKPEQYHQKCGIIKL